MAEYVVVAQVKCKCGTWVTIRTIQSTYGGDDNVPCWTCSRTVGLNGNTGYVIDSNGKKEKAKANIISKEVRKK